MLTFWEKNEKNENEIEKRKKRKLWQGQRKTRCKLKERKSKFQAHFMTNCGWAVAESTSKVQNLPTQQHAVA